MLKYRNLIVILALLTISLIFWSLPTQKGQVVSEGSYIVNPQSHIDQSILKVATERVQKPLNPLDDGGDRISLVSKLVNASLFVRGEDDDYLEDLVDNYWYDDGGKTISIILKENLRFADGKPLRADHIKNTYKALADPSYQGAYTSYVDNLKGYYSYKLNQTQDFLGIEVVDDHYIKFYFNLADITNINSLTFPILDIEDGDFSYGDLGQVLDKDFTNGLGRYLVEEFNGQDVYLALKNDEANKDIKLDKVLIKNLSVMDAINSFKEGKLDMVYKYHNTDYMDREFDQRTREYAYKIDNQDHFVHLLGFNAKSNLFKEERFRRAVRDSIDIEAILEKTFGHDIYNYTNSPVYENSWFNKKDFEFTKGPNLDSLVREVTKDQVTIKIVALETDQFTKRIEEDLVRSLESDQVKVQMDYLTSQDMYKALKGDYEFDIFISRRHLGDTPDLVLEEAYPVEGDYNLARITDQAYFFLSEKIKHSKQDPMVQNIVKDWYDAFDKMAPYMVLATENQTTVINSRIRGIYLNEFIGFEYIKNLENIERNQD